MRTHGVALAFLLALFLSACGSDRGTGGAGASTPDQPATVSGGCPSVPVIAAKIENPDNFNPCDPAAAGFALSFADEFDTIATIDLDYATPPAAEKNWYFKNFYSGEQPPANLSVENGVLTLHYMPGVYGLQTAAPDGKGWFVGRAFGGGGYFEARIAFDPDAFGPGSEGIKIGDASWPAFWGMAIEHGTFWEGTDHWKGQAPGYKRFIENDFFEYLAWGYGAARTKNSYASALHDWYGVHQETCKAGFCDALDYDRDPVFVTLPFEVDWRQFNTIGQLWKPARFGQPGYRINYFNGRPVNITYWWDEDNDTPPPNARNRFSIMDKQKLYLVLGTGPGAPIKVDHVRVWQHHGTKNNVEQ